MTTQLLATSPRDDQYLDMIRTAVETTQPNRLFAAIAYATHTGVAELDGALGELEPWQTATKRWLVGIDHCRSDPVALKHLNDSPGSDVRIFDGRVVSSRAGCVPRNSYHPKAYLLQGPEQSAVVVGSGNLSRTGLRLGVEAAANVSATEEQTFADMLAWYRQNWRDATPFGEIEEQYGKRHASAQNRRNPAISDDDSLPESAFARTGQLRPNELRKIRVCRHLWIQAGNLHHNLGKGRPGNQLMMKRNSRVFFGFVALDLQPNTYIGDVAIRFGGHLRPICQIRFSDNSMDVLTLPVPGEEGPEAYDQRTLHFTRAGVREFNLSIGSPAEVRNWKKRSATIGGSFKMKSGRQWGVY